MQHSGKSEEQNRFQVVFGLFNHLHHLCTWTGCTKLQQLFKVVTGSGYQHAFVSQLKASRVHSFHCKEVDQCAKYGFYGGLPELFEALCFGCLQPEVHLIIERLIYCALNLFEVTFSNALTAKGTSATIFKRRAVGLHLVSVTMRAFTRLKGILTPL
jgi:hypothetical protein